MSADVYGFVYILANAYMPGIYKIGMTTRSPRARAEELSRATGVPEGFDVLYYAEVQNPGLEERRVHAELAEYRVNEGREFFHVDIDVAIEAIRNEKSAFSNTETFILSEWGWGVHTLPRIKKLEFVMSSEVTQ